MSFIFITIDAQSRSEYSALFPRETFVACLRSRGRRVSAKGAKPSGQDKGETVRVPGRRPGHTGISHHRRSKEAVYCRPDRCGGTGLLDVRITARQITDIPKMPKAAVVTRACHRRACSDCDAVTVPKSPRINGTSLGPNLLAFLTGCGVRR